ncbi:Spx/MgsR family RNA polymerase-binding regulatory protein [Paenibacillus sp. MWE-103]|uniref:Spx/MgsR family RNA polymerase-binding regulatory protein n=1 Tax=Paenibacillus artemisiicola TaxID=1172618 RepID=A0ABS3W959_9BACL|nr:MULTISPECIES: Spx/MgsR family RNA polymerase-binding regulatory protein [Paenibacillus]MBO7744701.1 Spx/MgsR family RNA polymerase-binding regulatory protein [Paenibacillus artemisiicola]SFJ02382.1 arsenate reductase [Paenibacillus sp. UNC496MF]
MKKLTIYEYPKCGTSRSAIKWLKGKDYELEHHNLFETAPSEDVLAELVRKSGLEAKKFFNTSGETYKEMGLKDVLPGLSEREKIALLASNGRLIKRPVVTDGSTVTVGFKEDDYERTWG